MIPHTPKKQQHQTKKHTQKHSVTINLSSVNSYSKTPNMHTCAEIRFGNKVKGAYVLFCGGNQCSVCSDVAAAGMTITPLPAAQLVGAGA